MNDTASSRPRLLVVEDEVAIMEPLVEGLEREGFAVAVARTGGAALAEIEHSDVDLVLLDLGLPDVDGVDVCRHLRARSDVPIIVLTARGDEVDRVLLLELGADDYVVKPFGIRELVARIRVVRRRADAAAPTDARAVSSVTVGTLVIDHRTRRVHVGEDEVRLTPKEFNLLARLAEDPGAAVRREQIIEEVWDEHWWGPTKTLDVHIASLRKKLGDPTWISTVRGVGYRLEQRGMTRRLVVTYFTITAFALASLAIPLGITFAHREKDRLLFAIESDADAIVSTAQASVTHGKAPPAAAILRYATQTGGHVIVVDRTGVALLDTDFPRGPARDYSSRPEVIAALAGERANGRRHSSTLGTGLIYSAVPITGSGDLGIRGAVRITYPSATLDARVRRMWSQLALLCLLVLTVVMIVGWVLARSVTRPVRRLEDAANRVADGDLSTRVPEHGGPPELQHLERAFNQMASEIARLLAAEQQFVADASHQLRTPLTALRLRLENLDAKVNAAERPSVEAIIADLARLSRLVDGLLMLAWDDGEDLGTEVVDVAAVARARAEAWADVMTDRGVRLVVDASAPAWATVASGGVEQMVDNLVDNALAVSRAGDAITLRVESHDRPGRTELHVVDEGPGLDPHDRRRAFDRFWRAPDAPSGGSGLGLAIVARLAEVSGGSAALEAGPGGGIDAVVTLPRARAMPDVATERATALR